MSAICRGSWPNMSAISTTGARIDRSDNGPPAHREQARLIEVLKLKSSSRFLCSEAFITFISKPHDDVPDPILAPYRCAILPSRRSWTSTGSVRLSTPIASVGWNPRAGFEGHYGVLSRQDFAGVVAGDPIATEITARLKTLAKQLNVDGARAIVGGAGRSRRACSPRGEGGVSRVRHRSRGHACLRKCRREPARLPKLSKI